MSTTTHNGFPSLSEQLVALVLSRLRRGELELALHNGAEKRFVGPEPGPKARVEILNPRGATQLIASTNIGLAEGYMDGHWDTPDLDAVLALGLANLVDRPAALAPPTTPIAASLACAEDNSPRGSKRISPSDYDLGNDFYRLWLDDTMAYSSAMFCESDDLRPAQLRKSDHLLDLLQPERVQCSNRLRLGGFAVYAAQQSGCPSTGSRSPKSSDAWATSAVAEAGSKDRVDIRMQDYRAVPRPTSAIASIEMFEAVGEHWWPVFFQRIKDLLAPGWSRGSADDHHRRGALRSLPPHTRLHPALHLPGGMLPSPSAFVRRLSHRAWEWPSRSTWATATRRRLPSGKRFEAAVRACWRWASTNASCACGVLPGLLQSGLQRRDDRRHSGPPRGVAAEPPGAVGAHSRVHGDFPLCRSGTYSAPLA